MLKRILFALGPAAAAVAAVAIALQSPHLTQPERKDPDSTRSFDLLIDAAEADYKVNDDNADSAPKQQVVNGWIARDLLGIIARQNEAQAKTLDAIADKVTVPAVAPTPIDNRPTHLLLVLVLLATWVALWTLVPRFGTAPSTAVAAVAAPSSALPEAATSAPSPPFPPALLAPPTSPASDMGASTVAITDLPSDS